MFALSVLLFGLKIFLEKKFSHFLYGTDWKSGNPVLDFFKWSKYSSEKINLNPSRIIQHFFTLVWLVSGLSLALSNYSGAGTLCFLSVFVQQFLLFEWTPSINRSQMESTFLRGLFFLALFIFWSNFERSAQIAIGFLIFLIHFLSESSSEVDRFYPNFSVDYAIQKFLQKFGFWILWVWFGSQLSPWGGPFFALVFSLLVFGLSRFSKSLRAITIEKSVQVLFWFGFFEVFLRNVL